MAYKLIITEHADELLDHLVYYLLYQLKSEQAARNLLDGIVPQMNYSVVFYVKEEIINVVGIFHQLENYRRKI